MYQELRAKFKKLSQYSGLIFAVFGLYIIMFILIVAGVIVVEPSATSPHDTSDMIVFYIAAFISIAITVISLVCIIGTLVCSCNITSFIKKEKKSELNSFKGAATTCKVASIILLVCLLIQIIISFVFRNIVTPENVAALQATTQTLQSLAAVAMFAAIITLIVGFSCSVSRYNRLKDKQDEVVNAYDHKMTDSTINGQISLTTETTPDSN